MAGALSRPVVLKAQVLGGGRGKAGGIKFTALSDDVEKLAAELWQAKIWGMAVRKILVEEKLSVQKELYLGMTADPSSETMKP
jgi:succinyl-CoA synthetase beta subunit